MGGIGQPSFNFKAIKWLSFTYARHINGSIVGGGGGPHRGKKVSDFPMDNTTTVWLNFCAMRNPISGIVIHLSRGALPIPE